MLTTTMSRNLQKSLFNASAIQFLLIEITSYSDDVYESIKVMDNDEKRARTLVCT